MIIEAILNLIAGLLGALTQFMANALPAAPTFWVDLSDALDSVVAVVPGPILHMVPVGPALLAAATALTIVLVLGGVRFARRVLSIFTGGGGNA